MPQSNDPDEEVIASLVRRVMAIDDDATPFVGYIRIQGGSSMARARKLAPPVSVAGEVTPENVVKAVMNRLRVAKELSNGAKLWIQAVPRGESHPVDWEIIEGQYNVRSVDGTDDDGELEGRSKDVTAIALAKMGQVQAGEARWFASKLVEHLEKTEETKLMAAAAMARLEIIEEYAGKMAIASALKDYAPVVQGAVPEVMQAILNWQEIQLARARSEAAKPPEATEPADRVRNKMTEVETAIEGLKAEAMAAHAAGKLTPELQAELRKRAKPIIDLFVAVNGNGGNDESAG